MEKANGSKITCADLKEEDSPPRLKQNTEILKEIDEDENEDYHIQTAPLDAPLGETQLLICFAFLIVCIFLRDSPHSLKVACTGCSISTFLTIYYKLKLRPTSTYLLCALSVVMNSIAFGHLLSPMMATGVSSVVAAIQAFLSLPFSISTTDSLNGNK